MKPCLNHVLFPRRRSSTCTSTPKPFFSPRKKRCGARSRQRFRQQTCTSPDAGAHGCGLLVSQAGHGTRSPSSNGSPLSPKAGAEAEKVEIKYGVREDGVGTLYADVTGEAEALSHRNQHGTRIAFWVPPSSPVT